jgi:hypothetical protein
LRKVFPRRSAGCHGSEKRMERKKESNLRNENIRIKRNTNTKKDRKTRNKRNTTEQNLKAT